MGNKTKVVLKVLISVLAAFIIFGGGVFLTRYYTLKQIGLVSKDFLTIETKPVEILNFENKWDFFLDDEKAEYVYTLCEGFEVDVNLAMSILLRENPTVKIDVVGAVNQNGTVDIGMWQLNDRSLYTSGGFIDSYWIDSFGEFDPMNWRHNSYIAIRFIHTLTETFGNKNLQSIAAAYNCGPGRVLNSTIPEVTAMYYVPTVINTYKVLTK